MSSNTAPEDATVLLKRDAVLDHNKRKKHWYPNRHAINVLKQIEDKLDGRINGNGEITREGSGSPDAPSIPIPSSIDVHEHVEWLIEQATNVSNLSRLYEGWTAWI